MLFVNNDIQHSEYIKLMLMMMTRMMVNMVRRQTGTMYTKGG